MNSVLYNDILEYLELRKRLVAPSTYSVDRCALFSFDQHLAQRGKCTKSISEEDISSWLDPMREILSCHTIGSKVRTLRGFLRYLQFNGIDVYTPPVFKTTEHYTPWELADIYADAGVTGTSMEKRDEFNRMLADCRAGKINRVLVKAVSRFARNTLELLETIRELRELGVVVVFEEQGIDTSQMLGEMQLTMLALAAQEESTSISKNMRWSYQKRMENGTFVTTHVPIGFDMRDKVLVENQDAEIVREIFTLYNSGMGMYRIADYLNEKHGETRKWCKGSVREILTNEKYIGDSLFQKKYTTETMPFKERKNYGEVPQYYVSNTHQGIVGRSDFSMVQKLMKQRGQSNANHTDHLFTHRIQCPDCGSYFRHSSSSGKSYWICPNRMNKTKDCTPYYFSERDIIFTSLNMFAKLYICYQDILSHGLSLLREIEYSQSDSDSKLYELDQASLFDDRARKNNGEKPKYYVSGCLPVIVEPAIFDRVQEEIARRKAKRPATEKAKNPLAGKYSSKYALSELLLCGKCGSHYRRATWAKKGKKKIVWRCGCRLDFGTQFCNESPHIGRKCPA